MRLITTTTVKSHFLKLGLPDVLFGYSKTRFGGLKTAKKNGGGDKELVDVRMVNRWRPHPISGGGHPDEDYTRFVGKQKVGRPKKYK